MNGIEFLEQAMDIYPHARRVLLTAYADTDAAIDAINVVDLDHYLLKPWDPPEEKFYPVIDALLEAWTAHRPQAGRRRRRWSATAGRRGPSEVREFLARNQVPYRWYARDEPEGARLLDAAGARRHDAARRDHHRRRGARRARPTPSSPSRSGCRRPRRRTSTTSSSIGGGPAGLGAARVRRVRGPAHRAGRADRHRRAGRSELADRELPRLPRRRVRRAAHRAGPAAGDEVRRRDGHHPRRRRRSRSTASARTVRFADGGTIDAHTVILATGVAYRQLDGARARRRSPGAASTTAPR